jgi:CRISPR-associated endonuclease/helicase Cas3
VVSDLAPIAQLLQRAGRCQRHRRVDEAGRRPEWASGGPRLAVLIPRGPEGDLTLPAGWTAVYDGALLRRTAELLVRRHPQPVTIPGDIQPLVEEVYDESFGADPPDDEIKRLMADEAMTSIAEVAAIKPPSALFDLEPLTKKEIDEDRVSTRLGADAVRVICCFEDTDGTRWLDRARTVRLPERGAGPDGRFTAAQLRTLLGESIPLRDGDWRRDDPSRTAPPPGWAEAAALSDVLLLPHPVDSDGTIRPAAIGGRTFYPDVALGLVG